MDVESGAHPPNVWREDHVSYLDRLCAACYSMKQGNGTFQDQKAIALRLANVQEGRESSLAAMKFGWIPTNFEDWSSFSFAFRM